ncbi:MAG: cellulase family glycosylhydrolase, partial [Paludibacteraceae bacterium]|nr:cellulase family glycosylhydrolase [Paludibacteraceae bacterium]
MKKILSLSLFVSMSFAANADDIENHIAEWGQLKLVGNQLSSETGDPIQLKGWSTFSLHYGEVQGCLGESNWKMMHKYGANVVRLSMYVNTNDTYLSSPAKWKSIIKKYITELAAEGMYGIVDWHLINAAYNTSADPNEYTETAKDFFGEISEYCADNGYKHVLYEICNEPDCDWENVKKYAKEVIPAILKYQPNAMVIVDTDKWSQNIMSPVSSPLNEFKNNVLYSFHYYAGTDYNRLGEFRNAQKFIPVIASEWSTVRFDGNGPNNLANGDAFLEECTNYNGAPQLVSWCFWNWGKKNEPSSTFSYECSERNLSKSPYYAGEYIVNAMTSEYKKDCKNCEPYEVQSIPNTAAKPWRWENYDFGGEGYAYHDKNSSAYVFDRDGEIVDYSVGNDESDAYSWAYTNGILSTANPYYTVVDGKITSYDGTKVGCTADGKSTYKSLNGGKTYCGVAGSGRPDEGVDLFYATMKGTGLENKGYTNVDLIEDGEWINYTVDVAEPGYYKVQAYVTSDYKGEGDIAFYQKNGSVIRPADDLSDLSFNKLHFMQGEDCADSDVDKKVAPWDCWSLVDAVLGDTRRDEVVLEFKEAGVQTLGVRFIGTSAGIGPLVFTNMKDVALEFTVSPNPTFGSFTVTLDDKADAKLEVKDADNKVVYSGEITKYKTIDENLAPGEYTVVVTTAFGAVSTKKVVVKEKPENYVAKWGQLKLVGNQLSSETGDPIQLKGWSTFSLHYGEVQGCLGENNWKLMHQYGANVVRLAMYVNEANAYIQSPDRCKSLVKGFIDELAEEGMYCIVDWHLVQYGYYASADPNEYSEKAKDFFGEISEYCADNGYKHVLYEICNEPDCDWNNVKKYAKEVIPAILKNQPSAMVIVDTDNWSQNIMNPVTDPLNEYKNNVLYSFHYYAGTDFHKLGEFRNAQKFIPVIASEWSTVKFDGNGPNNFANGDAFLEECTNYNGAPQLVSWCFWNWGKKNEPSSTFSYECSERNLSKSPYYAGEYIVNAMTSEYKKDCKNCEPYEVQSIPNTAAKPWRWENYDFGGEGYAYHDKNSSAYVFDRDGEIVDYSVGNDESDAYSWAYTNGILSTANPYYTVVDGKITSYDGTKVGCTADGKSTYKSLNGGKTYCGVAGSGRPDEGVDLFYATMKGTGLENKGYTNVDLIEDGEWINYTVDVAEPGYYKVQAYVTSDYKGEGDIAFYQKNGSVIRPADDLSDLSFNKLHFMQGEDCADSDVDKKVAPWDCWSLVDAVLGDTRRDEVVLEFKEAGVQTLGVRFIGTSAGIGPLVFTNMKDVALEFTVSPNPTFGSFTVTLDDKADAKLEVKDADNKVVYSGEITKYKTIDENLAPGEYTVVVTTAFGAVSTKKVVVKEKPENYVAKWGQLKLVGNQLSSETGDPIQLKGWSTFSLHYGEVQGCLGENNWKLMHQYGANVVRLSMYVTEPISYLSDPDSWKKRIKDYIKELAAEGMYCIVDWHLLQNGANSADPNKYTEEAKDFFGEISEYCADNGYKHVLYEICNEPDCDWNNVKKYAKEVIPAILKNQPSAMVIVDTDNWSQNIMNPVTDPLNEYKNNVLYSFHYYAGTDFHKLGEFRNAQKFIPVIASEWSTVKFDGNGPNNFANGDAFLEECTNYNGAPQLVSWCFWNWGKKNEPSSTFSYECSERNLSKSPYYAGEYIVNAMTSEYKKDCKNCEPYEVQSIPNTAAKPWRWENYDFGGEGYAYHDKN